MKMLCECLKNGIRDLLGRDCKDRFAESAGIFGKNWTEKEILKLEEKLKVVIQIIILNPEFFPKSTQNPKLFKALIDKNNYLVYRENKEKQRIEIINFRGTRQRPVH